MSEIEPRRHPKKEVSTRHIPQEIVPVPIEDVRDLVRDAIGASSLVNPVVRAMAGWAFFEPHVRFTPVDATHTLVELDVSGTRAAETVLFNQRRAEIDRFFVAIQDELDRRDRYRPQSPNGSQAIGSAD